jgi:bifunctional non-homologous end joining protein LigD
MDIIRPMEPVMRQDVFDSDQFTYQVKWDGVRMLAYINENRVELINKRLNHRTLQYPELQSLPSLSKCKKAILDGEIVAFKDSRPSFRAVMSRDNARSEQRIKLMLREIPVSYMVFDLLQEGDRDLRSLPLTERQHRLQDMIKLEASVHLVDDFSSGTSLFTAVKAAELEGIVAKRKSSCYTSGKNHRDWFKIKYRRRQACVVGGYTLRNGVANSLVLGVYENELLHYVGRAGSGLSVKEWAEVNRTLRSLQSSDSPFDALPPALNREVIFVEPCLVVEVEFAEWTDDMHLRSPVIKGFLKIPPEQCQI